MNVNLFDRGDPSPCFHCPEQVLGCHSTCKKYIAYEKKRAEMRADHHKKRKQYHDSGRAHMSQQKFQQAGQKSKVMKQTRK